MTPLDPLPPMPNRQLLIIDAQNDFCDLPASYGYAPTLAVPGAHEDCLRLADFIRAGGLHLGGIIATLDSHQTLDMANAICWRNRDGNRVPPFTEVTAANVRSGDYRPMMGEDDGRYFEGYLEALETMGRSLTLWPEHCLIGTPGHDLHPALAVALLNWSLQHSQAITVVHKGENRWTESFSALKAVIPYPGDPATELNTDLLALLASADEILVAGQASSHCVKETVTDMLSHAPNLKDKLILLTDCMSPVANFEAVAGQFFAAMQAAGVRLANSAGLLAELNGQG